jgi:hypothetical protein
MAAGVSSHAIELRAGEEPAAPAAIALRTSSSSSNVVSTRILVAGVCARIARVAAMPSTSGMRRSIKTTSGRSRAVTVTASRPFPA